MRYCNRNAIIEQTYWEISCSEDVSIINRIIATVGKHIIAQQTLAGGGEDVGIYKAADLRIIISALQIIEPGFSVVVITAVGKRLKFAYITLANIHRRYPEGMFPSGVLFGYLPKKRTKMLCTSKHRLLGTKGRLLG